VIEKMKFISITGPKHDFDRMINTYLSHYEIQLENALLELPKTQDLRPYLENNPYKDLLRDCDALIARLESTKDSKEKKNKKTDKDEIKKKKMHLNPSIQLVEGLTKKLSKQVADIKALEEQKAQIQTSCDQIAPFVSLHYDIKKIISMHYIRFRFGRIPKEYWTSFQKYVAEDISAIFEECAVDAHYVWGIYFVPLAEKDKIDAIYQSLHFERIFLPDEYEGSPAAAMSDLQEKMNRLGLEIEDKERNLRELLEMQAEELYGARARIATASDNFSYRKMAATTKEEDQQVFYILCGWMTKSQALSLKEEMAGETDTVLLIEDSRNALQKPPTKLKNPKIFQPFELYTKMYGLPDYREFDPTVFIGITYSLIFGAMFGDFGQGLLLFLGGLFLYYKKKSSLCGIIASCGIFSMIFGLLFGSVFGFEDLIPPLWDRPATAMTKLAGIGYLNSVFVISILFGMLMMLITMALHVMIQVRMKNKTDALFDSAGLSGLVFYGVLVLLVVLLLSGHSLPACGIFIFLLLLSFLAMTFKEPFSALLDKKKENLFPEGKGMFAVMAFFHMFEVCLSFFSNTLSFIRIGAFAVSHAAMMEVVLQFANFEGSFDGNWIVLILGNLFVMGMEGLIVGIQVLRLEYYEFFGHFYHGTGRPFRPFAKNDL